MLEKLGRWFVRYIFVPTYIFVVERILGWNTEGYVYPTERRFILLTEPHTSNFDLFIVFYWGCKIRRRIHFLIKKEIATWFVVGKLLKWAGAIYIDRDAPLSALKAVIREARAHEEFILLVSPSGTRKYTEGWKPGFYFISQKTKLPLMPAGADFARKKAMLHPVIHPSGDIQADIELMRPFFESITAKFPEDAAPIRLLLEDEKTIV
jgi:1-acyl-sn-glycerol-3-phosphate acyltransferase